MSADLGHQYAVADLALSLDFGVSPFLWRPDKRSVTSAVLAGISQ